MKHSESIAAIAEALAAAQSEYVPVKKTKQATVKGTTKQGKPYEYTYMYADLADVLSMLLPRLSKQGIALSQPNVLVDGKLRVVTYLLHKTGEWMHSDGIEMSEEGDPQQFGIESTYFRRYDVSSFTGVAPDEDTDAQGADKRTRRTTPAQAMDGAISHQSPRPTSTQQSTQQAYQRAETAPASAQGQEGVIFKLLPPPEENNLICVPMGVIERSTKPSDGKTKPKPYLVVTVNGFLHPQCDPDNPNINGVFCYDPKLFDAIKGSVGHTCQFELDLTGKFVKLVDVVSVTDPSTGEYVEYQEGKPVIEGGKQ